VGACFLNRFGIVGENLEKALRFQRGSLRQMPLNGRIAVPAMLG